VGSVFRFRFTVKPIVPFLLAIIDPPRISVKKKPNTTGEFLSNSAMLTS